MSYSGSYMPWRFSDGRWWARQHIGQAVALKAKYGEVLEDVRTAFFKLPPAAMRALLQEYGSQYGQTAADYAKATMPKWQAGSVRLSGQTLSRLLVLVPKHLTTEAKFELLKKIRALTLQRMRQAKIKLRLPADSSAFSVFQGALGLIHKQTAVKLPADFYEIQSWISDTDAALMQKMVIEVEKEALYSRAADLFINIAMLQRVRLLMPRAKRISATFELPAARVTISIGRPRNKEAYMSETEREGDLLVQLLKAENEHRYQAGGMPFQEYVLRNMDTLFTPEQQQELQSLAAKQGLELSRLKAEILIKGETSAYDIKEFMKLLDQLKEQGAKANVSAEFQTPSGKIQIQARTNRFGCGTAVLTLCLAGPAIGLLILVASS